MKRLKQGVLATCALGVFGLAAMAAQGEWRSYFANDPRGRNVVVIESRAPLETIVTTTSNVVGEIKVNPDNILDNPQVRFELDLASLDTGIDVRNEHMRGEGWMNTEKYPKAVFTLTKIRDDSPTIAGAIGRPAIFPLRAESKYVLNAEGIMEMRGIAKTIVARIEAKPIAATEQTAARLPGELLHIRATFLIKLDDFGINVPAGSQLKVSNEQQVTVDIFTSTGSDAPQFASAVAEADKPSTVVKKPITGNNMSTNELIVEDLQVGTGREAKAGDNVTVHYRGTLTDGKQFDASYDRGQPFNFRLGGGQVIKGWDQGVAGMKEGGKRKLTIPPSLGYGAAGAGGVIPPNATLVFEVELLKVG